MANDRNVERNRETVESLVKLFADIENEPSKFTEVPGLMEGLSSQLNLGKFCYQERSVYPCSMSTLKRMANKKATLGFTEFDRRRKRAYMALMRNSLENKASEHSKEGKRVRARDLKSEAITLRQDIFLRDGVIFKLVHLLSTCAKELELTNRTDYFLKAATQELYRLGFKGSNVDER